MTTSVLYCAAGGGGVCQGLAVPNSINFNDVKVCSELELTCSSV